MENKLNFSTPWTPLFVAHWYVDGCRFCLLEAGLVRENTTEITKTALFAIGHHVSGVRLRHHVRRRHLPDGISSIWPY